MNEELSAEETAAGFARIYGALIYTPTGENCDDFEKVNPSGEPWILYAVRKNLEAIVGTDDPSIFPSAGWTGTIEDLAAYMGISAEEAASAYKHSPEAMMAARIVIGWHLPPSKADRRRMVR